MNMETVIGGLEQMLIHYNEMIMLDRDTKNHVLLYHKAMVEDALALLKEQDDMGKELTDAMELVRKKNERIEKLLKEQGTKQYNNHEVACIIADLFGDPCACNFNDIDEWLPYKCDFRETCCPNPVGVACWEQYLKHKEGR